MQIFFPFLSNPLFPPPQHPKADVQITPNSSNLFSVDDPSHRRDLELSTETSPPVTCLFHEPFLSETDHFFILFVSQFWGSLHGLINAQFPILNSHPSGKLTRIRPL